MDSSVPAVSIEGLAKRFPVTGGYRDILTFWRSRYVTALDGVDLQVPQGGIFGLLGANGAGKTSLLKILAGLVLPDRGRIRVAGRDLTGSPERLKEHVTYVPGEERTLYWRLTGRENLRLFAVLYEVPRRSVNAKIAEALEVVGLTHAADRRVGTYSTGMKQRLSIARGLLADAPVMLLDEPTRGMDPVSARQLWAFVQEELVGRQGRTIVLATHNMEEAAVLCGSVAVLHQGKVKACGPVSSLAAVVNADKRYRIALTSVDSREVTSLLRMEGVMDLRWSPPNGHAYHAIELTVSQPEVQIPRLVEHLLQSGGRVLEVRRIEPSLSEAIEAIGRSG